MRNYSQQHATTCNRICRTDATCVTPNNVGSCWPTKLRPVCTGLVNRMKTDATLLANNSQHNWMLHVGFISTPRCMLLHGVGSCCEEFETDQTFEATTPNFSFVRCSSKRSATILDSFACRHTQILNDDKHVFI